MIVVALTRPPSIERPLFLPQYVSEAPEIVPPRPCCLPSCIRTTTVSAIQSIAKIIVSIVLKICTSVTPPNQLQNIVLLFTSFTVTWSKCISNHLR